MGGETSQERLIKFRVNAKQIAYQKVVIEAPGMFGCVVTLESRNIKAPIHSDGSFDIR